MAGSFGFEQGERYQVAIKEGERVLLPRVRQAPDGTFVIADGFSCRTQVEQGSDRRALHLAEVLRLALRNAQGNAPAARRPELANLAVQESGHGARRRGGRLATVAATATAAVLAYTLRRRGRR